MARGLLRRAGRRFPSRIRDAGEAALLIRFAAEATLVAALSMPVPAVATGIWYRPPAARVDGALRGDPRAQAWLGYLYSQGRGVPQNHQLAAYWYRCAAIQGNAFGQFLVGLMYDKGLGVPQDFVLAHAWVNRATAHAPASVRNDWSRVRDAIATKMSLADRTASQTLAAVPPSGPPCVGDIAY